MKNYNNSLPVPKASILPVQRFDDVLGPILAYLMCPVCARALDHGIMEKMCLKTIESGKAAQTGRGLTF